MSTSDDGELEFSEIDIACDAARCYQALCDVQRVPEWVPGVARVHVVDRDDRGRARVAQFVGMPARGSVTYRLRYDYDDADARVRWTTADKLVRELRGEASVIAAGDGRCRLRYGIHVWAADSLPVWARQVLLEESPDNVVRAFQRWVERG